MNTNSSANSSTSETVPRRSMLFMPATNERAVNKASSLGVDSIILDMEDSVHQSQKTAVRERVLEILEHSDFGYREVLVRINALDTDEWRNDIEVLKNSSCDGLVVPKVETVEQIDSIVEAIGGDNPLPIWIMLESPLAILSAQALCGYGHPVVGMLMGTADLCKDLHVPFVPGRFALQHALSSCVLAARAAGIVAVDGVYMNIRDATGFEAEAMQGMQLGFDGKSLIHPGQLEICNRVFAPTAAEIETAEALIAAWQQASEQGDAVCVYDGKLVESLHVKQAQQRLQLHALIESRQ